MVNPAQTPSVSAFWPNRLPRDLVFPSVPVHRNLEVSALLYPEKIALRFREKHWTYSELQREVEVFSNYLAIQGVEVGDRVTLWLQNCPEFIIAAYGAWRRGAIVSPLSPMLTADELPFYLADSEPVVLVTSAELFDRVDRHVSLPKCVVLTDSQNGKGKPTVPWNETFDAPPASSQSVTASDAALLPYTSGTTGRPKGCVLSHTSLQATIYGAVHWCQHTAASVHFSTLPFFHVTGFQQSLNVVLATGGEMILMERWNRDEAARIIEEQGVTTWVSITAMLVDLLNHLEEHPRNVSSVGFIAGGGAAIPEAVHRKIRDTFGVVLVEGYGLTETISQTHLNPPDAARERCIGVPTFNTRCLVLDKDDQTALPADQIGEIAVSGPQVLDRYWKRPDETDEAFIVIDGKRYFRTGDLGYYDNDGYFYIVDRLKRMINAAGYKVWPAEVEARLHDHPAVSEACVVGIGDQKRGETTRALIILKREYVGKIEEDEIIAWSRGQMSAYKYPRDVVFVEELPRLASGKIDWRTIQAEQQGSQHDA